MMALAALGHWPLVLALVTGFLLFIFAFRYAGLAGKFLEDWNAWQCKDNSLSEASYEYIGSNEIPGFEQLASEQPDYTLLKLLKAIRFHLDARKTALQRLQAATNDISFVNYLRCTLLLPKPWSPSSPRTLAEFRALVCQSEAALATVKDAEESISFLRAVAKRRLLANFKRQGALG